QGVPWIGARRAQAQPAHPRGAAALEHDRCGGASVAATPMSALASPGRAVELDDVQGLVMVGYKRLTQACFILLRVKDPAAARASLAQAPVTSAAAATGDRRPDKTLHIAMTNEGLRALNVAADVREGFSLEFVAGMASDEPRARRLGDVGANAPQYWQW